MKCEFCENIELNVSGYDDTNFHENVIPDMKCKKCNKSTISENGKIDEAITKYPDYLVV